MGRSQNQQRREPITDRRFILGFGRYKGYSVDDILDADPGYLVWLTENTDFELGYDLLDEAENGGRRGDWHPETDGNGNLIL